MKAICLFIVVLCCSQLAAQLYISSGATLHLSGSAQLSLNNANLVNNGTFTAGSSNVHFLGNGNSTINGSQATQFHELTINKTGGNVVTLQRSIVISNRITFTSGLLDLNGQNIDLGNTGYLNNEQESSRIIGSNGGEVLFNTTLNVPSASNPGNLGAVITSSQNLGSVTIRRGHRSQVNFFGNGNSILRYYDIIPTNNASLNATVRFTYFDAELNSLPESSLTLWRSPNNTTWTDLGYNTRNATLNYVEKTGIQEFSRFTLSTPGNPLPVHFVLFNAKCVNGQAQLNWKTAQEINTSRFDVESSPDGLHWQQAATIPAADNSTSEQSYSIMVPAADPYFRVVAIDLDGRRTYTSIIKMDCERTDAMTAWPIPVKDALTVKVNSSNNCMLTLMLHDSKGSLLIRKEIYLGAGQNQLQLDVSKFSNGSYMLTAEWNHYKRTIQIIKQ